MKHVLIAALTCIWAAAIAQDRSLDAHVGVAAFEALDQHYAEIFVYVIGNTVASDSAGFASVSCTYFLYQDSVMIAGDKYNLITKTDGDQKDFMDLHRHMLLPGSYTLKFSFVDNADSTNNLAITRQFTIASSTQKARQSDLQLLASAKPSSEKSIWTKNGVYCVPLPFEYYHHGFDKLILYNELYGMDQAVDSDFFVRYAIYPRGDTGRILMKSHKRLKPSAAIPLLHTFDITGLSSGAYVVSVDVFTSDKTLLSSATSEFIRSNPDADQEFLARMPTLYDQSFVHGMDEDSVRYVLKSIAPRVSPVDVEVLNYLIAHGELDNQKRFIHQFWVEKSHTNPEAAFIEYMQVVNYADRLFSGGFGHGFETDRGYIYLRYGAPDDQIAVEDEPSAPPYEIWIYYDFPVTSQSDVKFLFYDPTLSNQFELLHSTAEGEVRNPRWEQELYRDALTESASGDLIDARPVADNFHRRAREYFKDY